MESNFFSKVNKFNRLGFHYYNDIDHYDEASLDFWLPKLQAAGTRWIVLNVPERAEIPEYFLIRLVKGGIEPIINLQLSLSNPPEPEIFRQRTAYYQKAGVHLIHYFDEPNLKASWNVSDWQNPNLVRKFVDTFCSLASICISNKIIPIFPTLEPGGDYWDMSFLKEALQILQTDYAQSILPNLIFSANAGFQEHNLDWGKGGPDANPDAKAYSKNQSDHRGFHIYEWYQALISDVLKKSYPIILFQTGQWSSKSGPFDTTSKESERQFFQVLTMIQRNQDSAPDGQIPAYVIACIFYKLPTEYVMNGQESKSKKKMPFLSKFAPASSPINGSSGRQALVGKTVGAVAGSIILQLLTNIIQYLFQKLQPALNQFAESFLKKFKGKISALVKDGIGSDYLLIPDVVDLLSDSQQKNIQSYLNTANCKSGRNLNEALASKNVILINDKTLYPQNIVKLLRTNNCKIRTLSVSNR